MILKDADPGVVAVLCLVASIPLSLFVLRHRLSGEQQQDDNHNNNTNSHPIPTAVGGLPLLGNALQYKDNPTGCILEQEEQTDSKLFRLNLAGRYMTIVGSNAALMKQVATQPARVLSSRKAVAAIGFEYTLGPVNVYKGTDWHKRILKDYVMGKRNFETTFLPGIFQALSRALEEEVQLLSKDNIDNMVEIPDLFHTIRRVVLRATLDDFVSPLLLQTDPGLLEALMVFQDKVEDATAKAAVLPRLLALPACLWPTQNARHVLTERISKVLPLILDSKESNHMGPWLKTYMEEQTPPAEAAEHLIGLIFAAHKNPAIGASQCICFWASELSPTQQEQATQEAKELCAHFTSTAVAKGNNSSSSLTEKLLQTTTLRACVLETLRMTAHTIGALRYAEQPVQVQENKNKSYWIPKGETVAIAHHSMHMQTSIWGNNATQFSLDRPEWHKTTTTAAKSSSSSTEEESEEDNNNDIDLGIPVDHYKLTTFSNGIHKCPGEKVALAIMELLLALLLERKVQLVGLNDAAALAPIDFERATLAQRKGAVRVKVSVLQQQHVQ